MDNIEVLLNTATRFEIIESIFSKLRRYYIFPETVEEIEISIRQRLSNGEYDALTNGADFAEAITEHLQAINHDKHLRVFYSTVEIQVRDDESQLQKLDHSRWPLRNFGFEKVERLPGNIGYLDFRAFYPVEVAGSVAVAAMVFLGNMNAIIIDLRKNHGGTSSLSALISSYFFHPEPVHLGNYYWRVDESTRQARTYMMVPGVRYPDKPLYILTSHETLSGAEGFAYNLKNLKRATIIGEITGGAAHMGFSYRLNAHFGIFIPSVRPINPITGTNWEGTGVIPDIEISQEDALQVAHKVALKKVLEDIRKTSFQSEAFLVQEIQRELANMEKSPFS